MGLGAQVSAFNISDDFDSIQSFQPIFQLALLRNEFVSEDFCELLVEFPKLLIFHFVEIWLAHRLLVTCSCKRPGICNGAEPHRRFERVCCLYPGLVENIIKLSSPGWPAQFAS